MKISCTFLCLSQLAIAVLFVTQISLVQSSNIDPIPIDPIAASGHGQLYDRTGKLIKPSPAFVKHALDYYLSQLVRDGGPKITTLLKSRRAELVRKFPRDRVTQDFLLVEWLTEIVAPENKASIYAKNRALRKVWYRNKLGQDRYIEAADEVSFFPRQIAKYGDANNMLRKSTTSTGGEYIKECRNAGVPIPPDWGNEGPNAWNYVGDLSTNFLQNGNPASVYRYDSNSPAGLCVALPRIVGKNIPLLSVTCMGRESSNVCFYEGHNIGLNESVDIETFTSGGSLGDVCSDCHAGENPYIVHPGGPLDMAPDNFPEHWYTPLVRPDWPHNPGPFALLSQVPINTSSPTSDGDCEQCHTQSFAGRFPDIIALNQIKGGTSGYCSSVLLKAIGDTMPGEPEYQIHIDAMKTFCGQVVPPGKVVTAPTTKDDPEVISPPIIKDLYACGDSIEVAGGIYGAEIVVTIDGAPLPGVQVTEPSSTMVSTPPLIANQVVTATQEKNGFISGPSQPVVVVDHTVAFPGGLPAPEIDPKIIHQCGRVIAVRHIPGAKVTIFTNGGAEVTSGSLGGDWADLSPKNTPFNINDKFTALQQLCDDKSDLSVEETAGAEPNPLPIPEIDPTPPLVGQQVIHLTNMPRGALTTVSETGAGDIAKFATSVTWKPEVDIATGLGGPLSAGDTINVVSELCGGIKVSFPAARPCDNMPAPSIAVPLVGATSVYVTSAVPGAHILVYDANLIEIGDGSGSEVGLTRALVAGDVLTVIQKLGECTSANAYQIGVICFSSDNCK